jgi:hypothetical protein
MMNEEMENFERGLQLIMKSNYCHRTVNWIPEIRYIVDGRGNLTEERSNEVKGSSVENWQIEAWRRKEMKRKS